MQAWKNGCKNDNDDDDEPNDDAVKNCLIPKHNSQWNGIKKTKPSSGAAPSRALLLAAIRQQNVENS